MTARVIIHPRCLDGPARGALEAHLQERGFDIESIAIGPSNKQGNCDLVRLIEHDGDMLTLERMDGVQFQHKAARVVALPGTGPEAA